MNYFQPTVVLLMSVCISCGSPEDAGHSNSNGDESAGGAAQGQGDTDSPGDGDPNSVVQISAGTNHTCAVLQGGNVMCWGDNGWGQLGDGTQAPRSLPVQVLNLSDVVQVSAGQDHTCARTRGGSVYCWGSNDIGQLGQGGGSGGISLEPVRAVGISDAVDLAAGGNRAAYSTCAALSSGAVACWGYNSSGPVTVDGPGNAVSITQGGGHHCTIDANNQLWCWGNNDAGQLGLDSSGGAWRTPTEVSGVDHAVSVSAGGTFTCALVAGGMPSCWGANGSGQLGQGDDIERHAPTAVAGLPALALISAGGSHACAVSEAGEGWCWGGNGYGRLGDGTNEDRTTPTPILGVSNIDQISAGGWHTCALVEEGDVFCWGSNTYGQLGDGTNERNFSPTLVLGLWL